MNKVYEKLMNCHECVKKKIDFEPKVALVLGSGLGKFADEMDVVDKISYSEIDGFPQSTVPGHEGRFVFGYVDKVPVVCMQGRVHYYEGYPIEDVNGFMCNNGRNYILSGYWKVYNKPTVAKRIFKAYDDATERMITELVS